MPEIPSPEITQVLNRFEEQEAWLQTLITDPTGYRYFQERTPEEQLLEFESGIARMRDFLAFAGNPQDQYAGVHVAGTSGKGSVVTMIAALLQAAGQRTCYHVSPYLQACIEKLIVNGRMISPRDFNALVDRFRELHAAWQAGQSRFTSLKYGEAWVALTFLWCAQQRADWAVIETGVGGRYDPTNLLPSRLAVITNVDMDHIKPLGPTLADIAHHKAGIIKPHGLAITAAANPTVLKVIRAEAGAQGARLYVLGEDFDYQVQALDASGLTLSVQAPFGSYERVRVGLAGRFQALNAALAISAVDLLAAQGGALQFDCNTACRGLAELHYPGRLEVIQPEPLVILDGAHNPNKMEALVASLQVLYPEKKVTALVGMLQTKDARASLQALLPAISRLVVTRPYVYAKPAVEPEALAAMARELRPGLPVETVPEVAQGIRQILPQLQADELLVITGSLYLLGEARNYWIPRERILQQALDTVA